LEVGRVFPEPETDLPIGNERIAGLCPCDVKGTCADEERGKAHKETLCQQPLLKFVGEQSKRDRLEKGGIAALETGVMNVVAPSADDA
jgi:hypothetical protein